MVINSYDRNMNKKIIIVIILTVAVISAAGYLYFSKTDETTLPEVIPEAIKNIKEKLGGVPNTNNWQTFISDKHGFSIKYPVNYEVKEENNGIVFTPPDFKDTTTPPKTLKELPLGVLITPSDQSYDEVREEIKKQREGVGYSEETAKVIAGVQGIELRQGSKPGSGDDMHQLFNIIPYEGRALIFLTFGLSKEQIEKQGVPLLNAFTSTFKTE